ncbi:MAG TPA: efflux RND transporter periplasmic adaptor subunit [Bacteroidota bacterium]|nr:efflux RND transporter periplasmic adaptor subunit [Bacteroidota bacterium]
MKKYWKIILPVVLILILGGVVTLRNASGSAANSARRNSAPLVELGKPTRGLVRYQLTYNGDVEPYQQATIYARITGNLESVGVNIGSVVRSGAVLARIDSVEPFDQVQQTAATYENARLAYVRSKSLLTRNLISKQDVDNLDAAMKVAKANYELSKTKLGYTRIVSPFPGIVTRRYLDPGTYLASSSTPLFQLMYVDSVKVVVNIQENDLSRVKPGTRAEIKVDAYGDRPFDGTVTRMADALDLATRSMPVEIDIANKDHALKPGMFCTVTLITGEHADAVTVPTMAIQKDETGPFVYVAQDNTAKRVRVQLGIEQGNNTEILSGLDGSESLIVVGQQLVRDGGTINIQK